MINKLITDTLNPLNIPVSYSKYNGDARTYITFFYYLTQGEGWSDDDEDVTGTYTQIDLWYKDDIGTSVDDVVNLLVGQGFTKVYIRDLPFETETGVYHTAISMCYLEQK